MRRLRENIDQHFLRELATLAMMDFVSIKSKTRGTMLSAFCRQIKPVDYSIF